MCNTVMFILCRKYQNRYNITYKGGVPTQNRHWSWVFGMACHHFFDADSESRLYSVLSSSASKKCWRAIPEGVTKVFAMWKQQPQNKIAMIKSVLNVMLIQILTSTAMFFKCKTSEILSPVLVASLKSSLSLQCQGWQFHRLSNSVWWVTTDH